MNGVSWQQHNVIKQQHEQCCNFNYKTITDLQSLKTTSHVLKKLIGQKVRTVKQHILQSKTNENTSNKAEIQ